MPKKITPPVPAEPVKPKIIERWGATEETWMLGHEDEVVHVVFRGDTESLTGRLLGTDRYTITVEHEDGHKILVYKHAIDFLHD
jgi:hypothetical protein